MTSFLMRIRNGSVRAGTAALGLWAFLPLELSAQAAGLGQQSLRPYWHVFAAYALVILLVAAWALSISRRLRDVESRLSD